LDSKLNYLKEIVFFRIIEYFIVLIIEKNLLVEEFLFNFIIDHYSSMQLVI